MLAVSPIQLVTTNFDRKKFVNTYEYGWIMGLQFYKVSMKPVYDDVGISSAYLQGIFT
jgi:hypothetical protein